MEPLSLELIARAVQFLHGRIRRTPSEPSDQLSRRLGVPVWLKLECLQLTGSFKIRGAFFRLSRLTAEERRMGIATCSAGNHGKAVAFAARDLGVPATIYVPSTIDAAKHRGMLELGAEVVVSGFPGYDETETWAREQADRSGKPFVSAFDDPAIMAGNGGTLGMEIFEDCPDVSDFIVPVGGGGLSGGLAFYATAKDARARIIACQHEKSPALKLSLAAGKAVTKLPAADTLAAGIEGGIGAQPFEILRTRVSHLALVSEDEIFAAVRWALEAHQYLIEPTAAATLAACLNGKVGELSGPAVVVITGRNLSAATAKRILCA